MCVLRSANNEPLLEPIYKRRRNVIINAKILPVERIILRRGGKEEKKRTDRMQIENKTKPRRKKNGWDDAVKLSSVERTSW